MKVVRIEKNKKEYIGTWGLYPISIEEMESSRRKASVIRKRISGSPVFYGDSSPRRAIRRHAEKIARKIIRKAKKRRDYKYSRARFVRKIQTVQITGWISANKKGNVL